MRGSFRLSLTSSVALALAFGITPVAYAANTLMQTPGFVRVEWAMRGGSCWINYTESNAKAWNHVTVAPCDKGYEHVGGLMRGRLYKFTVSQDGKSWTKVKTLKAQ